MAALVLLGLELKALMGIALDKSVQGFGRDFMAAAAWLSMMRMDELV